MLWDRVARLAGSVVAPPGINGRRLFVAEVQTNAVPVRSATDVPRRRQLPSFHRIPRAAIEGAATLARPGIPLTAAVVRDHETALGL